MSRYDMNYFNTLPLKVGNKLILKAFEETGKHHTWERWLAEKKDESFQPFSQYYKNTVGAIAEKQKVFSRTKEELLEDARQIRAKIEAGGK